MIEPIAVYLEECESGWNIAKSVTKTHFLILVTQGSLTYIIEDHSIHLKKGDVLLLQKGITRSALNDTGKPHKMYVVHFNYEGDGDGLPILRTIKEQHTNILQFEYMKLRFSSLTQHWLRKFKYSKIFYHSIILEMLAMINEEIDSSNNLSKSHSLVSQIQDYVTKNYRNKISMSELANLVDRTPNYISSIFKQTTGQTITSYIQQIRISAACDLLTNSQMNVGEVSDYLGFCEQSYFNRVFKKVTGTLPSTYMLEQVQVWK